MAVGVSSGASRIRRLNNLHRHKAQLPVNPFKTNDVKWLHFKVFWAVLGNGWTHFPCGCSRSAVISFLHFCVLCATCHYTLGWSLHGVRQLLSHSHSRSLPWILRHYRITGWSQISPLFQSYLNILSALNYNRILIPILSLLRINHHTDVATPLKLHNWDLIGALDSNSDNLSVLAVLDTTAAFDTVNHSILLQGLERSYRVSGNALHWSICYLSDRHQSIQIRDSQSSSCPGLHGIPQGSILGLLLFIMYWVGQKTGTVTVICLTSNVLAVMSAVCAMYMQCVLRDTWCNVVINVCHTIHMYCVILPIHATTNDLDCTTPL